MKEKYEIPEMTVEEMELGCPIMDGTVVDGSLPDYGKGVPA